MGQGSPTRETSEKTRLRAERLDEMRLENKNIGARGGGTLGQGSLTIKTSEKIRPRTEKIGRDEV